MVITTAQQSLNSGSVQVQILLTACQRLAMVSVFDNTGFQFLEGAAEKEGWLFYGEDCSFYIKNKLKSKIFNDKKVYIGVHRKSDFYEKWGVHKKPIYRGELPKKGGGFVQFDDLRGAWRKRSGWCFLMHTMIYMTVLARSGNFYNKTNVY